MPGTRLSTRGGRKASSNSRRKRTNLRLSQQAFASIEAARKELGVVRGAEVQTCSSPHIGKPMECTIKVTRDKGRTSERVNFLWDRPLNVLTHFWEHIGPDD